jgi:solute carrier family 6 GABA transporter-like protein 6/8/11/12/13
VKFYLLPEFSKLANFQVWADAGSQVFFSYSLCVGSMAAMGSYNVYNHNCFRDALFFALINSGTSFIAGFVIFTTLGFMAGQQGTTVGEVAESGPDLAFIVYPQAVAEMPLAPLWAVLFFGMILLLGTGSQIVGCEGVSTTVFDQFPYFFNTRLRKFIFNAFMCTASFLIGLVMVTEGGMYIFQLFDFYSGSRMITLLGFLECITIAYLYGVKRYYKDLTMMIGYDIGPYMKICWMVASPYTQYSLLCCV